MKLHNCLGLAVSRMRHYSDLVVNLCIFQNTIVSVALAFSWFMRLHNCLGLAVSRMRHYSITFRRWQWPIGPHGTMYREQKTMQL